MGESHGGRRPGIGGLKWLKTVLKWPTFKRFNGLHKLDETQHGGDIPPRPPGREDRPTHLVSEVPTLAVCPWPPFNSRPDGHRNLSVPGHHFTPSRAFIFTEYVSSLGPVLRAVRPATATIAPCASRARRSGFVPHERLRSDHQFPVIMLQGRSFKMR